MSAARLSAGPERLPAALLALAAACSAALLIVLGSRLYFYIDDWDLLLHRPGITADALLEPHVGHPSMSLVAVYKLLQATFGMDSITPFTVVATLAFVASAVVLFLWLRRRIGDWLALAAAVSILFLGSASEDLLTPFQLGFYVPMACGIGGLLALERDDRAGDAICCGLLVVALSFQSLGLIFIVAAAVAIGLDRGLRTRWWVFAAPAALYALWWLGWGHDDPQNDLSFHNLATSPGFILDGFSSSVSALFGLATPRDEMPIGSLDWGRPMLVALAVVAVAWIARRRRFATWLWAVLAAAVSFWFLIALNANEFRSPELSRYRYVGAILVLMIAAELLRDIRVGPRATVAVFAVVTIATLSNLSALHQDYQTRLPSTAVIAGGLGALDIARDTADPGLILDAQNSDFAYYGLIDAGSYLAASAEHGTLGYAPDELAVAPERARVAADKVLAAALGLTVAPPPPGTAAGSCEAIEPEPEPATATLPSGGVLLRAGAGADAELALRRYATDSYPIAGGTIGAGERLVLEVPVDRSAAPWTLQLRGRGAVSVCELKG